MSFICDLCKTQQEAGTKPIKIIMEKRNKFYKPQELPKKQEKQKHSHYDNDSRRDRGPEYGDQGNGWEITKEVNACPECASKIE